MNKNIFTQIALLLLLKKKETSLAETTVIAMTKRLTNLADASVSETDMEINMKKTVSQHVHKRAPITVTPEEIASAESRLSGVRKEQQTHGTQST